MSSNFSHGEHWCPHRCWCSPTRHTTSKAPTHLSIACSMLIGGRGRGFVGGRDQATLISWHHNDCNILLVYMNAILDIDTAGIHECYIRYCWCIFDQSFHRNRSSLRSFASLWLYGSWKDVRSLHVMGDILNLSLYLSNCLYRLCILNILI